MSMPRFCRPAQPQTASAMVRLLVSSTAVLKRAEADVEVVARARERLGVEGPVDHVGREERRRRT